jgi:hypothetical protein
MSQRLDLDQSPQFVRTEMLPPSYLKESGSHYRILKRGFEMQASPQCRHHVAINAQVQVCRSQTEANYEYWEHVMPHAIKLWKQQGSGG